MTDEKNIWDDFLNFESTYNLFDLRDTNGVYIWDIIRFDIYIKLLWNQTDYSRCTVKPLKRFSSLFLKLASLISLLFSGNSKKYVFFLSSRNKIRNKYFDQNAYSAINLLSNRDTLLLESYDIASSLDTVYTLPLYDVPPTMIVSLFKHLPTYDFSPILKLLKDTYPSLQLEVKDLQYSYRRFYAQRIFYRFLFGRIQAKVLFLTHNGVQKGLIAAAKDLNMKVYEFQHGIVDTGHLLYSYPQIDNIEEKVYLPDKIFSFSDFWFRDCNIPGVDIVPVGNDYFYTTPLPFSGKQNLLVVSADVFGIMLNDCLLELLKNNELSGYEIYLKLHPNQFGEYEQFVSLFKEYENVKIIKNEHSIGDLLKICDTIFAVQSTAVYEGLQSGRKVIILKESSYKRHAHIFKEKNVYLVKTQADFLEALHKEIVPGISEEYFFRSFDKKLFLKILDNE